MACDNADSAETNLNPVRRRLVGKDRLRAQGWTQNDSPFAMLPAHFLARNSLRWTTQNLRARNALYLRFLTSSTASPPRNNQGDEYEVEAASGSEGVTSIIPSEQVQLQSNYLGDASKSDWSRSYFGLSTEPFSKEIAIILQAPVDPLDIEVKPGL